IEKSRNVEILRYFELREISVGKDDTIEKVVIFDNRDQAVRDLEIDEVLVFIGYKADLGPIKEWGIGTIGRQIAVNGMMETSVPGVYAAGDIAHDGHAVHLNLICVGYAQAAVAVNKAAHYLNPKATIYPGHSSEMKF
ncbi:MAG: NAD(P)/FAD-dependent oxidoreductase, partial [Deltaproteobacteria bacterium]|nr:NAD(P)/FAD-dependent oxidoreductase [Deltaproteobacteria bacterium]